MLATDMPICPSQTHVHSYIRGVSWCGQVTEIFLNRGATEGLSPRANATADPWPQLREGSQGCPLLGVSNEKTCQR